jgi:HlyD family secretion protein
MVRAVRLLAPVAAKSAHVVLARLIEGALVSLAVAAAITVQIASAAASRISAMVRAVRLLAPVAAKSAHVVLARLIEGALVSLAVGAAITVDIMFSAASRVSAMGRSFRLAPARFKGAGAVRLPRRALVLALAGAIAIASHLGAGLLQSAPAAAESGAVARAARADVVLTVGGVGRIVQAGQPTEIALPSTAGSGSGSTASASGGAGGTSAAPSGTSATAVFPRTSGSLRRFLVAPGQRVAAGQALAVLDDRGSAAAAIAQAQNDVAMALVELRQKRTTDPLKGLPPTRAEIAAGHRAVTSARARLAAVLHGARRADISAARLDLRRAEAELETLRGGTPGARADAITVAQHNVQLAQERLNRILAPPNRADVAAAEADLRRAEADLALLLKPGVEALPAEITAARAAVEAARLKLARLLEPANPDDVTAARLELERAQAELRRLRAGPSPAALAAARLAVESARARLAQLLGPTLPADVAAARFDVFKAEADLAVLRVRGQPASPLDVALARLKVVGAQLRLESARLAKPLLTVRAPARGTVTALLSVPGAPVDPLTPVATVADLDRLEVTVDLSEFDVARVRSGLKATVSVDALGGKSFPGRVLFAALTGTTNGGVVTFPVRVGLTRTGALKPGMNVSVRILVAKRLDVVQVPLEAVARDDEDRPIVNVDAAGDTAPRRVTLGLASNKNVEIVKGLRAGEVVALPETQSQEEGD